MKGKVAIVAASSMGLGRAIARGLAEEGAKVVICARDEERLRNTAKEIESKTGSEVLAVRADVTVTEDIKRITQEAVERFGRIDVLVTNAGGPPPGAFLELSEEDWRRALDLNLLSAVRLCRQVVPHMRMQGGGRIINMTSFTVKQPLENLMLSNSIRMAVIGFAKTLSNELAGDNILVNNVCPGWTLTERLRRLLEARAQRKGISVEEERRSLEREIPMGRLGKPEEVADLVVFLASERAGFITGATIQVDGGYIKGVY